MFLILISLLSAGVALACAFAPLPLLCPAAVVAGLAFGAHWSLIPALASELFGLRYFASNYCLLQVPLLATYQSSPATTIPCHSLELSDADLKLFDTKAEYFAYHRMDVQSETRKPEPILNSAKRNAACASAWGLCAGH